MGLNYSVNTNSGALVALQQLNGTSRDLQVTQSRINSGKKIDTSRDNGAIWAIAKNQSSKANALDAVTDSLDRGKSTVDVALAAAATLNDTLDQMRQKALAASEVSLDTSSRNNLNTEYKVLRDTINRVVSTAEFNGYNLIKSGAVNFRALSTDDPALTMTVSAFNLSINSAGTGSKITIKTTSTISTATAAATEYALIKSSIASVNTSIAQMGAEARRLDNQNVFITKLKDALETGVGNLVDADLARESARLTALQSKQQLGVQALSIANQSTTILTSLFR
jgi:flagellin